MKTLIFISACFLLGLAVLSSCCEAASANNGGQSSRSIGVRAPSLLRITSGAPPDGSVGRSYGESFWITEDHCSAGFTGWEPSATGGSGNYEWSWSAAPGSSTPPGLSLSVEGFTCGGSTRCCVTVKSALLLHGSPTTPGIFRVILTVIDADSPLNRASAAYTIDVSSPTNSTLDATSAVSIDPQLPHYVLAVLKTWGGPNAYIPENFFDDIASPAVNNAGAFAGSADLSTPDPYAPACFNEDCQVSHAFRWENGMMADLGTLPGPPGSSSNVSWVTPNGLIVGYSENGSFDPGAGGPSFLGALWRGDTAMLLPPLKGGLESVALSANTSGIIVGISSDDVPDANSLFGTQTQTRAVVWLDGEPHDLGTLGGTDAQAFLVNEFGQITGQSYAADSIAPPTPYCSDDPLTLHGFFWEFGKMTDLNTLGGHCTFVYGMNNSGQVVGQSTIAEDITSLPFLWQNGKLKQLATVGGNYGWALSINDAGEIVGTTTALSNETLLATVWSNEQAKSLGALPGDFCSGTDAVNRQGQIVGGSGFNDAAFFAGCTNLVEHAVLWQGDHIYDLNQFVPSGSEFVLTEATNINELGEINGIASLPNGDVRDFLLIPCDENHPNIQGCDYSPLNAVLAADTRVPDNPQAAAAIARGSNASSPRLMPRPRRSLSRYRRGALPAN
jgi:probable HAF family extracellular repeat protein